MMTSGVSCMIQKKKSECNVVESKETESSETENAKTASGNIVYSIFYAKGTIHHEFVPE
jgi:hypothetical protein